MLLPQNDFDDGFATLLASLAGRWKELGVPTEALIWVLNFLDIEIVLQVESQSHFGIA